MLHINHIFFKLAHVKCTAFGSSSVQCLSNAADGVRLAARIVDTPCNEMNTDHFLDVSENISLFLYLFLPLLQEHFQPATVTLMQHLP